MDLRYEGRGNTDEKEQGQDVGPHYLFSSGTFTPINPIKPWPKRTLGKGDEGKEG